MAGNTALRIVSLEARDVRFPTSRFLDGSDAMHPDPDYSAAYVVLRTDGEGLEGHGLTFTIGRGTEICVVAERALEPFVVGRTLEGIQADMRSFWRSLVADSRLRWLGPEKGVVHLAAAAVVNAVWDLWAKRAGKPLWKLLVDLSPEEVVACVDFSYIVDVLDEEEALDLLRGREGGRAAREADFRELGYPAYTTSAGWIGYDDAKVNGLVHGALENGFSHVKMKVGRDLDDDVRRARLIRNAIGSHRKRVATGEHVQNRIIFKQLFQAGAIDVCQIDACRLGGVNEAIAVLLLAAKFGVPVCPHAGGVGLCEYVQHLAAFDYIAVSGSQEDRVIEWVDHLHEHFREPAVVRNGRYQAPLAPGYSVEMLRESLDYYEYPTGRAWADAVPIGGD